MRMIVDARSYPGKTYPVVELFWFAADGGLISAGPICLGKIWGHKVGLVIFQQVCVVFSLRTNHKSAALKFTYQVSFRFTLKIRNQMRLQYQVNL